MAYLPGMLTEAEATAIVKAAYAISRMRHVAGVWYWGLHAVLIVRLDNRFYYPDNSLEEDITRTLIRHLIPTKPVVTYTDPLDQRQCYHLFWGAA